MTTYKDEEHIQLKNELTTVINEKYDMYREDSIEFKNEITRLFNELGKLNDARKNKLETIISSLNIVDNKIEYNKEKLKRSDKMSWILRGVFTLFIIIFSYFLYDMRIVDNKTNLAKTDRVGTNE